MPKVYDTRKQRARELLERVKRGPAFDRHDFSIYHTNGDPETIRKIVEDGYRRWSDTWIVPSLMDLVPELRTKKKDPIDPSDILPTPQDHMALGRVLAGMKDLPEDPDTMVWNKDGTAQGYPENPEEGETK